MENLDRSPSGVGSPAPLSFRYLKELDVATRVSGSYRYPVAPLYPSNIAARARARWFEEYAATRMGDVCIWKLFNQVVIKRAVWGENPDQSALARTVAEADIGVACFFRNAELARFAIDTERWPRMAAWSVRMLGSAPFLRQRGFEDLSIRTPLADHRSALIGAGAPIGRETLGTANPRRGLMPT
jgi:glutathione S-transferase